MSRGQAAVPRHTRRLRRRRATRVVGLVVIAAVLFGATFVGVLAWRLQSNLHTVDISGLVGPAPTPPSGSSSQEPQQPDDPGAGRAMNLLLLGSDQRDGENGGIGGVVDTFASDTAIVVHLAADRRRVELVSIPRDSLVDIPACQGSNGRTSKAKHQAMFNEAFATGWALGKDMASAAACTWNTVQANTGLTIDHVVVVDFAVFHAMVGAIGGVDICIPAPMHDDKTGLDLPAGQQTLDGPTALKFARDRYGVGNGGDLGRIGNQQRLIAAIANQVLSADVLTSPVKVTSFLQAVTASLTVDSGLNLIDMTGLAYGLRSIRAGDITLMTIPTAPWPQNHNRLVWTPRAADVWANLAVDRSIVRPDGTLSPPPGASAPPSAPPSTQPSGPSDAGSSPGSSATAAPPASPASDPARTRQAGDEPFTAADTTAVCH